MSIRLEKHLGADGTAYHQCGAGSPVLLLHGVGLRAESWFAQLGALESSYMVLVPDLPGHGDSAPIDMADPTLAEFAVRVRRFIEQSVAEPVVVAGHSLGALIALELAARHPEICRGVAALSAIYRRSEAAKRAVQTRAGALKAANGESLTKAPIARWFGENPVGREKAMATLCEQWLRDADPDGYATAYSVFAGADGPADSVLETLPMPLMFLTGERDENSTPAMSQAMARVAGVDDAVIVRGARHMAQLTHAGAVNSALLDFAAGCHDPSPRPQKWVVK